MKNHAKWLSLLLVSAMLASGMASCSSSSDAGSSTPAESSAQSSAADSSAAEESTAELPAVEPGKITVELYDRSNTPANGGTLTDNYVTQYIADTFTAETGIEVEFIGIPRSGDADKLQVLMAGGTAPDICFLYEGDRYQNYAINGGLTAITDEMLDQYAPDLKEYLGEETMSYGYYNDAYYAIVAKRPITPAHVSYIRKDLVEAVGMELPTTIDEFYNVLKTIQEQDPAGIGSENIVPFGMHGTTTGTSVMNYTQLIHGFVDPDISQEDLYCIPLEMRPGAKEGFRFLNQMYNEGMISQDFALDDSGKQFNEDIAQGRTVFFSEDTPGPVGDNGAMGICKQNYPDTEWAAIDTFQNSAGEYVKSKYAPMDKYIMIPKASEDVAPQALTYLNWMSQHMIDIRYGEEGVHYTMEDGIPMYKTDEEATLRRSEDLWKAGDICIQGDVDLGNDEKNFQLKASSYVGWEDLVTQAYEQGNNDAYPNPSFTVPIESQTKYGANLSKALQELVVKSIMCAPADFDATYDSLVQEYNAAGGEEVEKEQRAAFQAGDYR